MNASTTDAGGARESGGGDESLTVTDARAADVKVVAVEDVASDDSEGDAEEGATNPSTSASTDSSQYCCVGGLFYLCPSAAALAQCASACTHNPSYDAVCLSSDAGSSGGNLGKLPAGSTNACGGPFIGVPCATGGQCYGSGEHCIQNQCYPNDVGNPCTYPDDCGAGNHCTGGCCESPAKGSPCQAPWDCKSGTCTHNVCQ